MAEYQIIRQLWKQLNATKLELRSLALDGMLHLAAYPKKMAKLVPALPDILARLKETNRAVNVKALKVLRCLLKSLERQAGSPFTVDVANQVIPLFDDASYKVRLAAIDTFSCLFDIIRREEKGSMKGVAIESLVPLMVHLYDRSPQVSQASREALKKVDAFLKPFYQLTIREKDPWNFSIRLLKRYRKYGESIFMDHAIFYVENSQHSVREAALRLLEVISAGSKGEDNIRSIAAVFSLVRQSAEPNNMDLTPKVMEAMAQDSSSETLQWSWCRRFQKWWRR